jgi:uncharacterized protein (DUF427 family)
MSLTTGRAPFGPNPAGRFDRPMPRDAVYVEPFLRRVRAMLGERTVIDSERVVLVHRSGQPPDYAFPAADVQDVAAVFEPAAPGYVRVAWDAASAWYEEEEQVYGGHPRNPYHRIDCVRAKRRLRVDVLGVLIADTTDVMALYETSRAPQLYVPRGAVRAELLVRSPTVTYCPYKGSATHWSAELGGERIADVAWSYDDPLPESRPIAGYLGFYPDRANVEQDVPVWFSVPPLETRTDNKHA